MMTTHDDDSNFLDQLLCGACFWNPIERTLGVIFAFMHTDWRRAYAKRGAFGVVIEFLRFVFSRNMTQHEFRRGATSGAEMEAMLGRHGVPLGDRDFGKDEKHLSFITKATQARWAEYLMMRHGMNVTSRVDSRNQEWADRARARLGNEPPVRHLPRRRRRG
jgi:hypothetical protein